MGHSIGKRTLKKPLGRDVLKFSSRFKMSRNIGERLVKVLNRGAKIRKARCVVASTDEEGAFVSQDAVHVLYQLMRRPDR